MSRPRAAQALRGLATRLLGDGLARPLVLQSAITAVLLTWPTVLHLNTVVLGGRDADTMKHVWTLWWTRAHLLREGLNLHSDLLNQPIGLELWPVEPLNGFVALLLAWLPVVAVANLLAILNLTATGVCAGVLGWELGRSRSAALGSALLLQSSSFALFSVHVGVGELQHLWLLPLGSWTLLRLGRSLQWRWSVVTGLVLGLGTVACFYYGFYLALMLLLLGSAALVSGPRRLRLLLLLGAAAVLAAAVVIPITQAFAASYGDSFRTSASLWDFVFRDGLGQTVVDPVSARLQPEDLLLGRAEMWGEGYGDLEAYGGGKLLGLPMLVLAIIGLLRRPKQAWPWLLVVVAGVVLALGSYASAWGQELRWSGEAPGLPFLYLNRLLMLVAEPLNFPVRFLAVSTVALVGLGALALRDPQPRWRWLVLCLVPLNAMDIQLRGLLPWPLPSFELPDVSALAAMDDVEHPAAGSGAVLDLAGALRHDPESRTVVMASQLHHQQAIQAVPIDRLEFHVREGRWFAAGLSMVEALEPAYLRRGLDAPLGDLRPDLWVLREAGFDRILLVSMGGREALPTDLVRSLEDQLGPPVLREPILAVWPIPAAELVAPSGPEQAVAWEQAHAERSERARSDASLQPGPMPAMGPHRAEPPPTSRP